MQKLKDALMESGQLTDRLDDLIDVLLAEEKQQHEDTWVAAKPEFKSECVLITASKYNRNSEAIDYDYTIWQIKQIDGEDDDGNPAWYWGLLNGEGEEYGELEDLTADFYKIIPAPNKPGDEQTHRFWTDEMILRYAELYRWSSARITMKGFMKSKDWQTADISEAKKNAQEIDEQAGQKDKEIDNLKDCIKIMTEETAIKFQEKDKRIKELEDGLRLIANHQDFDGLWIVLKNKIKQLLNK